MRPALVALLLLPAPALAQNRAPAPVESASGFTVTSGAFTLRLLPYVQAQYEAHQDSENELSSDGAHLLNQDRFLVRRGRLVIALDHRYAQMLLELDANTVRGTTFGLRQAEATLRLPLRPNGLPWASLTLGMFRTPFGYEVPRSARDRVFMENSVIAQAFFPGESDLGLRAQGALGWFRYALAVVNGHPLDEARFSAQAPARPADVVGRLGVDVRTPTYHFTAGVSALGGSGFHPGSPQGVDGLDVHNANESGQLTPDDLILLQGRAAVRSQTFARFAAGLDASLEARFRRVAFHTYGEAILGQNMDRGVFVADPVLLGQPIRELGFVVGATATLFDLVLVGARVDFYNPHTDSTANQAGRVVIAPRSVMTESFLAGVQIPGTATRLIAQYDLVQDALALGADGLPTDLRNNRFTLRVQLSP